MGGDLDLTPEQWAMCRQAGAAFTGESDTRVEQPDGQQLSFDGQGPALGELFRNQHTGTIATVVKVQQRTHLWVTLRAGGRLTEIPAGWLGQHWTPCRPDGRPR